MFSTRRKTQLDNRRLEGRHAVAGTGSCVTGQFSQTGIPSQTGIWCSNKAGWESGENAGSRASGGAFSAVGNMRVSQESCSRAERCCHLLNHNCMGMDMTLYPSVIIPYQPSKLPIYTSKMRDKKVYIQRNKFLHINTLDSHSPPFATFPHHLIISP